MKLTRRVWIGLGTAALVGTGLPARAGSPEPAQAAAGHGHDATKPAQGGEGGEAGGAKTDTLKPSLKFYRGIALIRGHLLVGDELVGQGRWVDALPHFLHPVEEVYPSIKGELRTFNVRPFEAALKALAQTVKAKKQEAYASAQALVRDQLDATDAALRAAEKDWDEFVVETALETLHQAAEEYGDSIEAGRFTKAVEYQDARGFVWQAEAMINSVASELKAKDAAAFASLQTQFAALKAAFPSALPPAQPVKDTSAVLGDVARIELYAGHFL